MVPFARLPSDHLEDERLKREKEDSVGEKGPATTHSHRREGVTIAQLAAHLKLTKGTISAVLNNSPYASSIPQRTKDRILAAATELNYRPNYLARYLRQKRSFSIGVVVEEIGDPYSSVVVAGVESVLSKRKYIFLAVAHRHDPELMQQYVDTLGMRGVEGIIAIDSHLSSAPFLPVVAIAGYSKLPGVQNIVLDHHKAAKDALEHLIGLGHRHIAVFRGEQLSSDSSARWNSIREVAEELGAPIHDDLVIDLQGDHASPQPGFEAVHQLHARKAKFTAIFAYNDMAAIGSIQALKKLGLNVPGDVSVVGFDDVREATFYTPSLTTVRQPLRKMGEIAAEKVLERIEGEAARDVLLPSIKVEPEFVIRQSTGPVRKN